MNFRLPACAFLIAILSSCGQSGGSGEKAMRAYGDDTGSPVGLCDSFDTEQFAMDPAQAALLSDSFLLAYRHNDAQGRFTAENASLVVPKELMMAFESLLPGLEPATQCLGVRIAYGLNADFSPMFLFAPVAMTRVPSGESSLDFQLGEADQYYTPVTGEWQAIDGDTANAAMDRYGSVMMKYVGGSLQPIRIDPALGSASDPSSTLFPFTEFRELIRENEAMIGKISGDRNEIPSLTAVRLRWAAETIGDGGGLKHVIMIIPVLDGPSYSGGDFPLTLKAANMNNVCPPKCANAIVSYGRVR